MVLVLTLLGSALFIALRPGAASHNPLDEVDLHYRLRVVDPERARLAVSLRVDGLARGPVEIGFSANAVAASAPVSKFRLRRATDHDGDSLEIHREGGLWSLPDPGGSLTLDYEVWLEHGRSNSAYADEVLSRLDRDGGRLLGSDIFLFPFEVRASRVLVEYDLPLDWQLVHPFQTGTAMAEVPGLRALYNSAVAVGPYRTITRQVEQCRIVLAVQGEYEFGDDDLMAVIESIVAHQVQFFGNAPRSRYLFLVNPHPDHGDPAALHYFGLHFDSSMIVLLDPRTDRARLQREPASLCAHEFFHNWLGEQLAQENYGMNWFVEGVTTWYAYRTRLATRMLDMGGYAEQLADRYRSQYLAHSLRSSMSVAEAGGLVLQDPAVTSFLYAGGLFVAVALDAEIGAVSQHAAGLDHVLRNMVRRARLDPDYRLRRETLEAELRAVTGYDFAPWLDRHVYGVETLSLPAYVTSVPISR